MQPHKRAEKGRSSVASNTTIPCTTNAECNPTRERHLRPHRCGSAQQRLRASTISTVLDNCDPCWRITPSRQRLVTSCAANRHANRDPMDPNFVPGHPLDNQAGCGLLEKHRRQHQSFEETSSGKSATPRASATSPRPRMQRGFRCPVGKPVRSAQGRTSDSACTQKTCQHHRGGCNVDGDVRHSHRLVSRPWPETAASTLHRAT